MGLYTASNHLTALAATATIATPTELWCGKMVAVSPFTANPGDGPAENTTLVRDISIPLTSVHVLVIRVAHMTTHLGVLVTRVLQVEVVVQTTKVQWLTVEGWGVRGAFCTQI
jgi:hypothetical protein